MHLNKEVDVEKGRKRRTDERINLIIFLCGMSNFFFFKMFSHRRDSIANIN